VQAASKAVYLDERNPYSHYALAIVSIFSGQLEQAIRTTRKAIEISPSFALGHLRLRMALLFSGRASEAVTPLEHGPRLSPYDPQTSSGSTCSPWPVFSREELMARLRQQSGPSRFGQTAGPHWKFSSVAMRRLIGGRRPGTLRVKVDDFEYKRHGKIVPHGVYDVGARGLGQCRRDERYRRVRSAIDPHMAPDHGPQALSQGRRADDHGRLRGSNGARVRLWKVELQRLADETGLTLRVHNYQPGTSKWNRIEHRLFCHITQNWRGRPLTDRLSVVELIATTRSQGRKSGAYFFVSP
jgi:Rhodopirellula transposase DDE domain